jgi:hypothetical protein
MTIGSRLARRIAPSKIPVTENPKLDEALRDIRIVSRSFQRIGLTDLRGRGIAYALSGEMQSL